ncbi:hypothetical protein DL93DRAFT_2078873 [Clavulina sp. PMI_390]|nr:hypothetical protein DL93DRAFT_2078873 [Clavulina sp. PMI_390]
MHQPLEEFVDESNPDYNQIAAAHGLLASYPFASATPTAHVARHLGPLSLTSPIPSLAQPHLQPPMHPNGLDAFLHGPVPTDPAARQVWEQHRNALIHGIQAEAHRIPMSHSPQGTPPPSTSLNQDNHWAPSNHGVSALSASVLGSVAHHPPVHPPFPPASTPAQSSLGNAPGHQAHLMQTPPQTAHYSPESSSAFFDDFLRGTLSEIGVRAQSQMNNQPRHPNPFIAVNAIQQGRNSPSPTVVGYSPSPAPSSTASTRAPSQYSQTNSFASTHATSRPNSQLRDSKSFPTVVPPTPEPQRAPPAPSPAQSSPDPLALRPGDSAAFLNPGPPQTPSRKRKSPVGTGPFGDGQGSRKISSASQGKPYVELASPQRKAIAARAREAGNKGPPTSRDTTTFDSPMQDGTMYEYEEGQSSGSEYEADTGGGGRMLGSDPPLSAADGSPKKSSHRAKVVARRDDRVPLRKLTELMENIFEAEDSLAPDVDTSLAQLPASFQTYFSHLTTNASAPLLNMRTIRTLSQHIAQVANPSKRSRRNAMTSPIKGRGSGNPQEEIEPTQLSELDVGMLGKLLKILGRSVEKGAELADPFLGPPAAVPTSTTQPSSPSKKGAAKKSAKKKATAPKRSTRSRSRSHDGNGEGEDASEVDEEPADVPSVAAVVTEVTDEELAKVSLALEVATESVAAATCVTALLAADTMPKQLYSEETIRSCITSIKYQLARIIYPFAEGLGDLHGHNSAILQHTVHSTAPVAIAHRKQIGALFQRLDAALPQLTALMQRASPSSIQTSSLTSHGFQIAQSYISLSEDIIIDMVYVAIGPFFVVETLPAGSGKGAKEKTNVVLDSLGGNAALRGLRLKALSLVRTVFEANPSQREWIIMEILSSLVKLPDMKQKSGQFLLRNGRSIHVVTALLIQLVQTSAHETALQARDFAKKRRELVVGEGAAASKNAQERLMLDNDREEMNVYASALKPAFGTSGGIFAWLCKQYISAKGKGNTKSTNEGQYKAILDTIVSDLVNVLYWPEWPGAAIMLTPITTRMIKDADDRTNSAESNGLRGVALDHLGTIAARIKTAMLKNVVTEGDDVAGLPSLETIMEKGDIEALTTLISAHDHISQYLSKSSAEDVAINDSGREMRITVWCHEISNTLTKVEELLHDKARREANPELYTKWRKAEGRLRAAFRSAWKPTSADVFTEIEPSRADFVSEIISLSQVLKLAFEKIMATILNSLKGDPVPSIRSKALRALGEVIVVDPSILRLSSVKDTIVTRLTDSSPQVRDAVVELIGKYMISSDSTESVAADYYDEIAARVVDTGLGVRKRVVKLLKSIYAVETATERRIDICQRLIGRMVDEDDTVKDLAKKTLGEIWFPSSTSNKSSRPNEESEFDAKLSVVTGVVARSRDRYSPLEDLLYQLAHDSEGEGIALMLRQYEEICDALIDRLHDGPNADMKEENVIQNIRTIHLFTTAHPAAITSAKASNLLVHLKNPSNPAEQTISDYVLKTFRLVIPTMPKSATKFGQDLLVILEPMVIKPSPAGGVASLQESVATLCITVKTLTHNPNRLISLLKSCDKKLQAYIAQISTGSFRPADQASLVILICITSLLCAHYDFDDLRLTNPDSASSLDGISKHPIHEHLFQALIRLHKLVKAPSIRVRVMQCLGFLYRSYPTLMTEGESTTLMNEVFSSEDMDARAKLLRVIQDFLMSESAKFMAQEKATTKSSKGKKDVDMGELIGNVIDFADSGVSSAVVQMYFHQIIDACVTDNAAVQSSAIDILGYIVKQGLAHPLQCLPAIIALETSSTSAISIKALNFHAVLYNKHPAVVSTQQLDITKKAFEYQQRLDHNICGYRTSPTYSAVLDGWYALVREKRPTRQQFLKEMVKALNLNVSESTISLDQHAVDVMRYMIENLASFTYATLEEPLTVIRHIISVLSVVGLRVFETLGVTLYGDAMDSSQPMETDLPSINFTRFCTCATMLLILKGHLKSMYSLSEDKCMKWVPDKKSPFGDKPAKRRDHQPPLVWNRVPFATRPILGADDQREQHQTFRALWEEEGVSPEPMDDAE